MSFNKAFQVIRKSYSWYTNLVNTFEGVVCQEAEDFPTLFGYQFLNFFELPYGNTLG